MVCAQRDASHWDAGASKWDDSWVESAQAAMKVTRPVIVIALLYFSCTDDRRSQKKIVDAIMDASVKLSEL